MTRARDLADLGDGIATADIDDGAVTAGKLNSTLDLSGKTVTLPSGVGGKVLQVLSKKITARTGANTSNNTFTSIDSLAITPTSSSSKIYITGHIYATSGRDGSGNYNRDFGLALKRNSSYIGNHEHTGTYSDPNAFISIDDYNASGVYMIQVFPYSVLDEPATTSEITYTIGALPKGTQGTSMYINRDEIGGGAGASIITLMEIAG